MDYLKLDDFKQYCFLSSLTMTQDGQKTAIIVKKANENNGYNSIIFVDKGNGFCPLTNTKGSVSSFLWLDNENILFSETRDEDTKAKKEQGLEQTSYYKININGGEAQLAFTIDAAVANIERMPNGHYLVETVFDNNRPDFINKSEYEINEILKELKKEQDYQVIDELPYVSNGSGFVNKKRHRLYLFCEKNGLKPITAPFGSVGQYKLSPCGKYVAFSGTLKQGDVKEIRTKLYLIDLENGHTEALIDEPMFIRNFEFWNDKLVVSASYGDDYSLNEHAPFLLLDLKTKQLKKLAHFDRQIGSAVGTDCSLGVGFTTKVVGNSYYLLFIERFHTDIHRLDLKTGAIENITNAKGSIELFDVCGDKIQFVGFINGRLQEVFSLENNECKKLTGFNDEIYDKTKHPKIEHHVITDQEGVEFDGWVLFPIDYDASKKYPAILDIHGGPKGVYGDIYYHEMQHWANENYFVLFSNPRGSCGKGNVFANIRGEYGRIDYDNIMQFTDEMIEKYSAIDIKRIGVTGGSYGGYMTNWIIGHTNRFAAAVTQRSIANWTSYMIGDLGYYFTDYDILANPWSDFDKLWWHSPLKYLDKAKTPTLIIHSDEDYRCSIPEAYQVFTALKLQGVETRLCIFHGENHGLSRSGKPDHRVRRLKEITDWMNHYLK